MQNKRLHFKINKNIKRLKKLLTIFRNPFDFLKMHKKKILQKSTALTQIYELAENDRMGTECIIFSKDRPLQLNTLIASYKYFVADAPKISITFGSSNDRYKNSYLEVFERHKDIIKEIDFREDDQFQKSLLSIVNKVESKSLFFLVDDNIFTREITISSLANYDLRKTTPSLRMHEKLEWCYNQYAKQKLPPIYSENLLNELHFSWVYDEGEFDWNYPLSLDGHLFDTEEIKIILNNIDFNSPNSLELNMQLFNEIFKFRRGVAYKKPVMVNVPCNRIQDEINNPFAQTYHQEELLEKWEYGLEIDFKKISNIVNTAAHQSVEFSFVKRT